MRIRGCFALAGWLLAGWILPAAVLDAAQAEEVRDLAARADALMRLGVAEKGASRAFDEASAMLIVVMRRFIPEASALARAAW